MDNDNKDAFRLVSGLICVIAAVLMADWCAGAYPDGGFGAYIVPIVLFSLGGLMCFLTIAIEF